MSARPREPCDDGVRERVVDGLRGVYDPCCREKGISVVDMGLVQHVHASAGGVVRVDLLLTSGWCPFAARVLTEVAERVEALPDVSRAEVQVVWDEAWTTDRLSPDARRKLQFLPPPSRAGDRDAYVAAYGGVPPEAPEKTTPTAPTTVAEGGSESSGGSGNDR